MSKIGLIIGREYLTRVKKKSFLVMTILGPLLFTGFFAAVLLLSKQEKDEYKLVVLDKTKVLSNYMPPMNKKIKRDFKSGISHNEALKLFKNDSAWRQYDYYLWLPENAYQTYKGECKLVYRSTPSLKIEGQIKESIRLARESILVNNNFKDKPEELKKFRKEYENIRSLTQVTTINIDNIDDDGEKINEDINYKTGTVVGIILSFTIFIFIFFFGSQVMRGVIEEKTSRIIEVIISSVKPFQLMMGKILGVGLVGLTQFVIWGILTSILIGILSSFFGGMTSGEVIAEMSQEMMEQNSAISAIKINENIAALISLPWLNIILSFLFYFLAGYLIYSALFAAIGAAVDNETDTQQFMMPVTIPLILAIYVVAFSAIQNPDSPAIFWLSLLPLTSPVVMLVRISMGEAALWEVLLSMGLLIVTFIGVVWVAGKVYRTGILMYGKKPSYKEIFKWLKY